MTRTDAFVRTRKLNELEVASINLVLKSRARRYIAAGKEEWLDPQKLVQPNWADIRHVLMPKDELWRFGGKDSQSSQAAKFTIRDRSSVERSRSGRSFINHHQLIYIQTTPAVAA